MAKDPVTEKRFPATRPSDPDSSVGNRLPPLVSTDHLPAESRPEHSKEITIPILTTIIAQPPPVPTVPPPPPNPANTLLGRYLLHPGQETSEFLHHALRVLGHVVVPFVVGTAAVLVGWKVLQVLSRLRSSTGGHMVEVRLPATVDPKGGPAFWRNVHSVLAGQRRLGNPSPHVAFEIDGSATGTSLRFFVAPGVPAMSVARAVGSAWPGAQCVDREAASRTLPRRFVFCGELRLAGSAWRSLWTGHVSDPLRNILGTLDVGYDAHAVVQILARPASSHQMRAISRAIRSLHAGKPTALVPRLLAAWQTTTAPPRPDPLRSAEVRRAVEKVSDLPAFEVVVRYGVSTDAGDRASRRRLRMRAREVTASFGVYAGDNHFVPRRRRGCRRHLGRRKFGRGQLLGLSELATLAHLPYDEAIPGLTYAGAAAVAPPPGVPSGRWRGRLEEDDDAWL